MQDLQIRIVNVWFQPFPDTGVVLRQNLSADDQKVEGWFCNLALFLYLCDAEKITFQEDGVLGTIVDLQLLENRILIVEDDPAYSED